MPGRSSISTYLASNVLVDNVSLPDELASLARTAYQWQLEHCSVIDIRIWAQLRAQISNLGKLLRLWNYLVCILAEILLWLEQFCGHDDD